ncbi:MAG: zinc ABC transporter substrate-binding protein [SAR202 cluster bacterium]|nr:zinc ABC transporter substrate-binding protein [SAR202 cluster bacterium]
MRLLNLLKKFSLISIAIFMIACGNDDESSEIQIEESPEKQINVLATTPMLGEYVKQVAGDNINVDILMPYSADPHHFEPSPQDVTKIESADLVFYVGLKYETAPLLKLLENSSNSKQALIEIGEKINPIEFEEDGHDEHEGHGHDEDKDEHDKDEHGKDEHEGHGHDEDKDEHDKDEHGKDEHEGHGHDEDKDDHEGHGHEGHDHGVYDPHFWFDPTRVALAVDAIKVELINIDPENKDSYETSANNYKEKLTDLDVETKNLIATIPSDQRIFITTHEALGYLEARYDLEVKATIIPSITTEDTATPKQLVEVIEEIKEHEIKVLFMESESPTKAAEVIAQETGITLVSGLWVETLQEGQSYVDFMKSNVNIIVENLKV